MRHQLDRRYEHTRYVLTRRPDVVQHVSHFSQFGLIAFDFFRFPGRFDNRPGLFPVTGTVVAAGYSASGRTVGNPVFYNKSTITQSKQ